MYDAYEEVVAEGRWQRVLTCEWTLVNPLVGCMGSMDGLCVASSELRTVTSCGNCELRSSIGRLGGGVLQEAGDSRRFRCRRLLPPPLLSPLSSAESSEL